jgi:hypothetical protein
MDNVMKKLARVTNLDDDSVSSTKTLAPSYISKMFLYLEAMDGHLCSRRIDCVSFDAFDCLVIS